MNDLARKKGGFFFILIGITLFILISMLYFGIRLKGFRPENNVKWLTPSPGIHFDRFSIAYTDDFFIEEDKKYPSDEALTIEMILQPLFSSYPHFQFVLSVHGGRDSTQLFIGQWKTWFVVMNGEDYDGRGRKERIILNLEAFRKKDILITITSDKNGTHAYVNGDFVKSNRKLILNYPKETTHSRLVVANSVHGRNSWIGTMYGLTLYDIAIEKGTVLNRYNQWREGNFFDENNFSPARMVYNFTYKGKNLITNEASRKHPLIIPSWMKILKKEILLFSFKEFQFNKNFILDTVVNFIGFIPLGFFLGAIYVNIKIFRKIYYFLSVVFFCFCFSLLLETIQIWIPSRTSSMLDLILNTSGGFTGSHIYLWGEKLLHLNDNTAQKLK